MTRPGLEPAPPASEANALTITLSGPVRRRAIYFQGFGEKGHLFSGIGRESIIFGGFREQGAEEKHFKELGRKVIFHSGSTPPPLGGGDS